VTEELDFYASVGPMTDLGRFDEQLAEAPTDPVEVAAFVRNLLLHPFWAEAYGVTVPEASRNDVQIRGAAAMLDRILEIDPRPLADSRELDHRFFGNCRHFSTLTVALLRRAGVPSRARCGFAGYFEPGKWVDHWIVEHWDGTRWVRLDPQIDDFQRRATGLDADPADLPPGQFLAGGEAWLACQSGDEDPEQFGILDMWGAWFIRGNLVRDIASLNKVEMLPWDVWGVLAVEPPPPGSDAYVGQIAELTASGEFDALRSRYRSDDGLQVPSQVMAMFTLNGPTAVDVFELS